jgi:hypothetical protein
VDLSKCEGYRTTVINLDESKIDARKCDDPGQWDYDYEAVLCDFHHAYWHIADDYRHFDLDGNELSSWDVGTSAPEQD